MTDQQLVPSVAVEKFDLIKPKLPKPVQEGYEWHSEDNRRQAVKDAEALWFSMHFHIKPQIEIYQAELLDLFHKDNTDRVRDLIQQATGYDGRYYHRPVHQLSHLDNHFTEHVGEEWRIEGKVSRYYYYQDMKLYAQKIPLDALRALQLLEAHNIQPYQFWVATLTEHVQSPRSLPDPLLCVGYNLWVVSVAEWK